MLCGESADGVAKLVAEAHGAKVFLEGGGERGEVDEMNVKWLIGDGKARGGQHLKP